MYRRGGVALEISFGSFLGPSAALLPIASRCLAFHLVLLLVNGWCITTTARDINSVYAINAGLAFSVSILRCGLFEEDISSLSFAAGIEIPLAIR